MARDPYDGRGTPQSFGGVFSRTFLLALLLGLTAVLGWRALTRRGLFDPGAEPRPVVARGDLAADEASTIELFEAASPSVVHISTTKRAVQRGFFRTNVFEMPEGSGSGFVWDREGHVVTNYHVLQNADDAEVALDDHTSYRALLVGADPQHDLAVLQIDAPAGKLVPIAVGSSGDLRVGQKTFAIGNPFGLDHSLTTGVISGLDREILSVGGTPIPGVIQTDAAINPGNSGGPLLDSAGRLIGINTAIQSPSGAYAGVGFAVPVDTINRIVPALLRGEAADARPRLGVRLAPESLVTRLGWQGALVDEVLAGTPAQEAGLVGTRRGSSGALAFGDLIVAVDGVSVRRGSDLQSLLRARRPDEVVELEVVRDPGGRGVSERIAVRLRDP